MTISQALLEAKKHLLQVSIQGLRPSLESELLLAFVLETTREYLHTWGELQIDEQDLEEFWRCLKLRTQNYPIEYITKQASFYERNFYVDHRVLIPRPETELLIDSIDFFIREYHLSQIAEVGIGSGIISITLALKHPNIQIIATDVSKEALEVAAYNIKKFHTQQNCLQERIQLLHTNLLDGIENHFDLLISNPPYISLDYPLEENVLLEPHCALFGGKSGNEVLLKIIETAAIKKVKFLACEIGFDQKKVLQEALEKQNYQSEFYRDYAGFDRGFVAKRSNLDL